MVKNKILARVLAILLIGGFVSADNWITYDPDANVQWKLNSGFNETEQDFVAGTITITNGTKTITILDRNLGATTTGAGKSAPTTSYGNYYQWGNNYGFPSDSNATITKTSTKIDTSTYGPGNPYSSDVFIKSDGDWSSVRNDNLRGGEGDDDTNGYGLTSDNPITGRQGPCPEGYHVPSLGDWNELIVIWYNNRYYADLSTGDLFYLTSTATLTGVDNLTGDNAPVSLAFSEDMLVPFSSIRWYDDGTLETSYMGLIGMLWSSTPDDEYSDHLNLLRTTRGNPKERFFKVAPDYDYRGEAGSIRCFKDENEEVAQKTLTFNALSGDDVVSTGIYYSVETPTSGQILQAISWLSDEIGLSTGYHFAWYTDDGGVESGFDLDLAIAEGAITSSLALTGKIEPNKYAISFLDENGAEIMSGEFTYDQEAILPANTSTKQGYTFKGWKDGQGNTYADGATIKNLTTENGAILEFTPIRQKNQQHPIGGGGGNGGGGNGSDTTNPDPEIEENMQNSGNEIGHGSAELENGYTKEMNDAYNFAYKNGITTMDSIEKADMGGLLTRIAMAKMLSYYAINVLGMKPDETRINEFNDVSDKLSSQYDNGVNLAYQLGIMGINMMNNMFRPFDLVTRAEFGTALSRMLYGIVDGEKLYYSTHLKKLMEEKIITNNNPNLKELRGYVMIMLMRSAMTGYNFDNILEGELYNEELHEAAQQEVENYFTEAYKMGKIYYRIGDLQRLLQYLGFYNGDINNTYDKNTVNAVYDFQIYMGILDSDDTQNPARGYLGPETRDALNQKWAEFK